MIWAWLLLTGYGASGELFSVLTDSDDLLVTRRNPLRDASEDGSRLGSPKIKDARDLRMDAVDFTAVDVYLPRILAGDELPASVRFFSSRECRCGQARVEFVLNESARNTLSYKRSPLQSLESESAYGWSEVHDIIEEEDDSGGLIGSVHILLRAEPLAYAGTGRYTTLFFCQPDALHVAEGSYDMDVCLNRTVGAHSGKPIGDLRGGVVFNQSLPNGVYKIRAFVHAGTFQETEYLPVGGAAYVFVGDEAADYKFSRAALKYQSGFYSNGLHDPGRYKFAMVNISCRTVP